MDELDRRALEYLPKALELVPIEERGNVSTTAILKDLRKINMFVDAVVPVLKEAIATATAPLEARIAELESSKAASGRRRTSRVTPRDDDGGA